MTHANHWSKPLSLYRSNVSTQWPFIDILSQYIQSYEGPLMGFHGCSQNSNNAANVWIVKIGCVLSFFINKFDLNYQEFENFFCFLAGLFTWTPKSLSSVSVIFLATSDGRTSELGVLVKICECSNDGTCNYDQSVAAPNNQSFQVSNL